jgi:hypothetical protein
MRPVNPARPWERRRGVQDSQELRRIADVPRRVWEPTVAQEWADRWTQALRREGGTMSLRPIQAIALSEIAQWGGGFFPIRVGGGKTLISLLAPRVVPQCARPLLLLPAHLRDKTRNEMRALREHWKLPAFLRIESYQMLSRVNGAELLTNYAPDLIICDEAHYLKNPGAACTKRMARYLRANREAVSVFMSGTITKRSIRDFAHLASWALGDLSPAPADFNVLDEWSRALDVNVAEHRRLSPGALRRLGPGPEIRKVYRDRLVETPGVVATQEGPLPIELRIKSHSVQLDPIVEEAYRTLREMWTTPDDWPVEDGVAMWRHARELSSGFYSKWDPRPPEDWRDARREWASMCRDLISSNRRNLDTELQVRMAVLKDYAPHARPTLDRWLEIQPTFEPNAVAVWVSDRTVDWIANRVRGTRTLVWTERPALGLRLAEKHGLPYYANLGVDARTGRQVEQHGDGPAVLSIDANAIGRNLQKWNKNLIVDVPPNGAKWEQMLARTHRDGQASPVVDVDVLFGCIEDVRGFWRAVEDSEYAEDMTGQAQKLVHADLEDVEAVETAERRNGPAWQKSV